MAIRQQDGNLIGKKLTQEIKDKYRDARIYKNDTVTCKLICEIDGVHKRYYLL